MTSDLQKADGPRLEYYSAVLDGLKRYIDDGHAFSLATEAEDGRTAVTLYFESGALSPYMAHLDGSVNVVSSQLPEAGNGALAAQSDEPAAIRLMRGLRAIS